MVKQTKNPKPHVICTTVTHSKGPVFHHFASSPLIFSSQTQNPTVMELSLELFYVTFFYLNLILAGLSLYLNSHRLPFPLRMRLAALGLLRPEPAPRPAQPNRRNIRPPAQPNLRNNRPSQAQPSRTAQPEPSPAKPAEPARCPVKPKTRSVKLETHPTNLKPAPTLKLREPKPEQVKPDVESLHEPESEANNIERESNRKLGWRNRVTSGFRKIRRCF